MEIPFVSLTSWCILFPHTFTVWLSRQAFHMLYQYFFFLISVLALRYFLLLMISFFFFQNTKVILNSGSAFHLNTEKYPVIFCPHTHSDKLCNSFSSTTTSCAKQFLIFSDQK